MSQNEAPVNPQSGRFPVIHRTARVSPSTTPVLPSFIPRSAEHDAIVVVRSITIVRRSSQSILLAAGAVALAPLVFGVPQGDDWFIELVRVQEYQRAFAGGDILPTWAPEVLNGFGSRDFMFFPPLFAATAAGLGALAGSVGGGVILALMATTLLAMWTMHRAARSIGDALGLARPGVGADIASAAYVLAPFLVFDRHVRNSFSELVALAILPLGIWALAESSQRPLRASALAAVTVAGLVLSHLLTVFIGAVALVVVLALLGRAKWIPLLSGAVAGLSVSAWFWLPLWTRLDTVRAEELTNYGLAASDNLLPISEMLWPSEVPLGPGPIVIAAAALALAFRTNERSVRRLALGSALVVVVLMLVSSPLAELIWRLDTLSTVQFPWRLWSVHALIGSLALGAAASTLGELRPPHRMALAGIIVAAAAVPLAQIQIVDRSWTDDLETLLARADLPYRATIGFEYLPQESGLGIWLDHDPDSGPIRETSGGTVTVVSDDPYRTEIEVEARSSVGVFLAAWDVPEWTVRGASTRFRADGGTLGFGVDAGSSTVVIEYEPPPLRRTLERLTPGLAALWLFLAWRYSRRRERTTS